ncbi:Nramp family divalent metal transporter [Glaciihabitans sp. GrIS 2.15]|uniref:Nramp family divalent metal transporter n=1 Tax=Glaciihabitans sp. GrIS 2.15 TaxID=3071710 RepID=UPI0019A68E04|nr:Nramp family divalent metal transporter [Microbacteriaceae bacterium]MEC5170125.1 manganese transport protein [Glaciihabitans sp. GrIS 2.15]
MSTTARSTRPAARGLFLLGPAFVAAIAYVDPGNVAANLTGGARYGYLLVWVLVVANLMAGLVQYQSAKLGLVSGRTLPELLGDRLKPTARRLFWVQAELVAAATDLAEVIGGAIALNLLFGLPLFVGGLIVGAVSTGLLALQSRYGQRPFETVIIGLLAIIAIGFLAGLFITPPDGFAVLDGLIPRFDGTGSVLLSASMLGATVMPHAIYVHSALARDRHGHSATPEARRLILRTTRLDVIVALGIAGIVNIGMLLLAAVNLRNIDGTDTISGAHAAIGASLGPGIALVFSIGLLASGLASTSVGTYAGATIMAGLLKRRIPVFLRRLITLVPAVALLAAGIDPTAALVVSQVFLSFGIPFALVPLLRLTNDPNVMAEQVNRRPMRLALSLIVVLVVALNFALIGLTVWG